MQNKRSTRLSAQDFFEVIQCTMGPCGWVHTTAVQKGPVPRATIGEVVSVIQVTQRSWLRRALTTHIGIVVITCYYWTKPLRIYNKFNLQPICNDTIKRLCIIKTNLPVPISSTHLVQLPILFITFSNGSWIDVPRTKLPNTRVSHSSHYIHLPLVDTDSRTLLNKDMLMAIVHRLVSNSSGCLPQNTQIPGSTSPKNKGGDPWDLLGRITSLLDWVIRESIGRNSTLKTLAGSA